MVRKSKYIAEFGDFQTPDDLADRTMCLLKSLGVKPKTILEPSCGKGSFLVASAKAYPDAKLIGLEINKSYLQTTKDRLPKHPDTVLIHGSFFDQDWGKIIDEVTSPLLITGNPPWVTNAELGILGSDNLPTKSNFQKLKGFEALTGKSNFDISEWMLIQNIKWLNRHSGVLAVLCKTAVARKVIVSALKQEIPFSDARIYKIDALENFGAAVDACLFYVVIDKGHAVHHCDVYETLESTNSSQRFGFIDGRLVSDIDNYNKFNALNGLNKTYSWRSGVKHDCAKVMEFDSIDGFLINGYGQKVDLEDSYLYPLVKSSDISGARIRKSKKFVLVTQKNIGADTDIIRDSAPKTWAYLQKHGHDLDKRGSVIYRDKPRFSIFGVGDYTFAPWKIAISGLYKNLNFKLYGPDGSKPVLFDDTVNFLSFQQESVAIAVLKMLQSKEALAYLESMIFWDEKRPITVDILKRMDIEKLAELLRCQDELSYCNPLVCEMEGQLSFLNESAA